jgi:NADH-quinone oxidoreductase subunit M
MKSITGLFIYKALIVSLVYSPLFMIFVLGILGTFTSISERGLKYVGVIGATIIYLLMVIFGLNLNPKCVVLYSIKNFFVLEFGSDLFKFLPAYILAIDNLSATFLILTAFLIPACILLGWNIKYRVKEYLVLMFFIEYILFNVFTCYDLVYFYIFYELVLIPMVLLIGIWGSRDRRIHATYKFFLYTFVGSLFMLVGIVLLYLEVGTTSFLGMFDWVNGKYLPKQFLYGKFIWICFFISFAIKTPMVIVHIWLPEAHVEAPTAGSVLLAGILLKMGGYGMLRFVVPLLPEATNFFKPVVFVIAILGLMYTGAVTARQADSKKTIAYSSVVHMNFCMLGILNDNVYSMFGALYLMIGHGYISAALFICIGHLYDRNGTRNILYQSNFASRMPIYAFMFFMFTISNVSFPGTANFWAELMIMTGLFGDNPFMALTSGTSVIATAIYMFGLFNRVLYGRGIQGMLMHVSDLNRREFYTLVPFLLVILLLGLNPVYFMEYHIGWIEFTTKLLLQAYNPWLKYID